MSLSILQAVAFRIPSAFLSKVGPPRTDTEQKRTFPPS